MHPGAVYNVYMTIGSPFDDSNAVEEWYGRKICLRTFQASRPPIIESCHFTAALGLHTKQYTLTVRCYASGWCNIYMVRAWVTLEFLLPDKYHREVTKTENQQNKN